MNNEYDLEVVFKQEKDIADYHVVQIIFYSPTSFILFTFMYKLNNITVYLNKKR